MMTSPRSEDSRKPTADRVELFFQRGLFNLHYLSTASLPYYQTIPDPTPDTLAEQAASAMEWVTLTRKEELTNTYADSWVSENGFIQFTTGDDPLDDPLPGTNPWCIHPSSAPKEPAGPLLVPSKLPEGMERTVRDRTSMHTMLRKFQNEATHITMFAVVMRHSAAGGRMVLGDSDRRPHGIRDGGEQRCPRTGARGCSIRMSAVPS